MKIKYAMRILCLDRSHRTGRVLLITVLMFIGLSGTAKTSLANHELGLSAGSNPFHSDIGTVSVTQSANVNNPDLRGFDPSPIAGPNDLFPNTSRPCCVEGSTQFGNGLSAGASGESINQNCAELDSSVPVTSPEGVGIFGTGRVQATAGSASFPLLLSDTCGSQVTGNVFQNGLLFQQSRNGLLSRPQTSTTACNSLGNPASDQRCNEITFGFLQDIQSQSQGMDMSFVIRSLTDANGNLLGAAQGTVTQSITEGNVTRACSGTFTFDSQNGFVMTSGPLHEC